MRHLWVALAALICAGSMAAELNEPQRIYSGDEMIDVDVGHAAPWLHDMNADGKRDLLVGQFGSGKLRVYHNVGTEEKPKYDDFEYFQAGGEDAGVPSG